MTKEMKLIRETIQKLVDGKLTDYEWDDNMSTKCKDSSAEALRTMAWQIQDLFPTEPPAYCSEKGLEVLKLLLEFTGDQAY